MVDIDDDIAEEVEGNVNESGNQFNKDFDIVGDIIRGSNGKGKVKAKGNGKAKASAKSKTRLELTQERQQKEREQQQKEEYEYWERIKAITRTINSFEEWQTKLKEKYDNLHATADKKLPGLWYPLEFGLSVKRILNIKDWSLPFAGIVLGNPSSLKTLAIDMIKGLRNNYYTHHFSPRSFVSYASGMAEEELQSNDLLPKIKNRCLLTPELAPTFSAKDDDIIQFIGILTSILDGHGYGSDSGVHGHRGYDEDMMFTWIGAAVSIPYKVHKLITTLGPKLYFFRVPHIGNKADGDYYQQLKDNNFDAKAEQIRQLLTDYEEWFDACPSLVYDDQFGSKVRKMPWISNDDDSEKDVYMYIIKLGKLLAHLRGVVTTWETKGTQGTDYSYGVPIIEEPDRAMKHLLSITKGHALSTGRNYITKEDLPLIIRVVLSTAPIERVIAFDLLISSNGRLTTSHMVNFLDMSRPTALRTMTEFKILGLVWIKDEVVECDDGSMRASAVMTLKEEFNWLLGEEFNALRQGFKPERIGKEEERPESELETVPETEETNHKEKYPPQGGDIISNSDNENNLTFSENSSKSDNDSSSDNIPLSRGQNSLWLVPTTQTKTTITTDRAHDSWFAHSSGLWYCNNCNASGDRFFIEETRCKGVKK